jgi:hypothetical protein
MNDFNVRRQEMFNGVIGFLDSNPILFREGSPGHELANQFKQSAIELQTLSAAQVSAMAQSRAHSEIRSNARSALIEALDQITRTSRGMAATVSGIQGKFFAIESTADSKLLMMARSFAANAKPFQKDFVDFEMAPDFLDKLNEKIRTFELAVATYATGRSEQIATSHCVDVAMQKAMRILGQLDAIVENKLKGDSARTLQWESVRKTRRAAVSKKPVQAKPAA